MRRIVLKLFLIFLLATTAACTLFSAGPYVLEFRYDPSVTPTPQPSATPPAPLLTALPTPGGADLNVTGLTVATQDGQPLCNADTPISLTITNSGQTDSAETDVRVLQVGPSRLTLFNEAAATVPALAPGATHSIAASLPLYSTPNSVYTLFGIVDQGNANNEVNEADNQQSLVITVTCNAAPNLQVTALAFTEVNCVGETTVQFTVANTGDADASGSMLYIDVTDTTVLAITNIPALPPDASYSGNIKLILYELPDGNYRLSARADASMTIVESDETDNSAQIAFAVTCRS